MYYKINDIQELLINNLKIKFIFRNFTELHLAQIKTIVPDFFKFSLVKSQREKSSYELVIAPIYSKLMLKFFFFLLSVNNFQQAQMMKITLT